MFCYEILLTYWWACPLVVLTIILTMGIFCFLMLRKGWCTMAKGGNMPLMSCSFPFGRDYTQREKGGQHNEVRRDQERD